MIDSENQIDRRRPIDLTFKRLNLLQCLVIRALQIGLLRLPGSDRDHHLRVEILKVCKDPEMSQVRLVSFIASNFIPGSLFNNIPIVLPSSQRTDHMDEGIWEAITENRRLLSQNQELLLQMKEQLDRLCERIDASGRRVIEDIRCLFNSSVSESSLHGSTSVRFLVHFNLIFQRLGIFRLLRSCIRSGIIPETSKQLYLQFLMQFELRRAKMSLTSYQREP